MVRRIASQETVLQPEAPYFRELYALLWEHWLESDQRKPLYSGFYLGPDAYDKVVFPWLPKARIAIAELAKYRSLKTLGSVDSIDIDNQFQWYAFSRVNDQLLSDILSIRPHRELTLSKHDTELYKKYKYLATHYEEASYADYQKKHHKVHLLTCRQREAEYVHFFHELGFSIFYDRTFHPFYHEIVEVIYDDEFPIGEVAVSYVYWPGLMFGDMMFSRAGVQVLCREGTLIKEIAENSTIFFTYDRSNRLTCDLSQGWGSNSQWGTDFRLDYEDATSFYFHVQGKCPLGEDYAATLSPFLRDHLDDLTIDERIELLINRCFVACPKDDWERWPFSDRYKMPKAESSNKQPERG